METVDGPYYRWSGRFDASGAALALSGGLATAALLGAAYAYADLYIPIVGVVSVLLACACGFGTGLATGTALRAARVRHAGLAWAVLGLAAAAAVDAGWAVWMFAFLRRSGLEAQLVPLVRDPRLLWRSIVMVSESGAWELGGTTPTGPALWVAWACEAATIVGLAVFTGYKAWNAAPYCERCGTWCLSSEGVGLFAKTDREGLRASLEAHDLGALERLGPPTSNVFLRLDLAGCPKCRQTHTATVQHVVVTRRSGKKVESTNAWAARLLVSEAEAEQLRLISARVAEQLRAAAAATA